MATKSLPSMTNVHPLVVFWLGLLTGAIVVGLVFFYRILAPVDYQSASFKWNNWGKFMANPAVEQQVGLKNSISPNMVDKKGSISPNMRDIDSSISPNMHDGVRGSISPNM